MSDEDGPFDESGVEYVEGPDSPERTRPAFSGAWPRQANSNVLALAQPLSWIWGIPTNMPGPSLHDLYLLVPNALRLLGADQRGTTHPDQLNAACFAGALGISVRDFTANMDRAARVLQLAGASFGLQHLLQLSMDFVACLVATLRTLEAQPQLTSAFQLWWGGPALTALLTHDHDTPSGVFPRATLAELLTDAFTSNWIAVGMEVRGPEPFVFDFSPVDTFRSLVAYYFCALEGPTFLSFYTTTFLKKRDLFATLNAMVNLREVCNFMRNSVANNQYPELQFKEQVDALHQDVLDMLRMVCEDLTQDPDKLAGADRTFQNLSNWFPHVYQLWIASSCEEEVARHAHAAVAEVQCIFVSHMLRSTNFNHLLSGARECKHMLTRAEELPLNAKGEALQVLEAWMQNEQVISKLLKTNLHQRQYADLVQSVLQVLMRNGLARAEHLDMLWEATEAEGVFDVVKTNVYGMIQDLAAHLQPDLLEYLFAKFEVPAPGRSVADSLRLLDLLKKLATSPKAQPQGPEGRNNVAERLLALIWKLTMPVDAPVELLACNALAEVLQEYGNHGHHAYCHQYLGRCCEKLVERYNVYPAMRMLRSLLAQLCSQRQISQGMMNESLRQLEQRYKLQMTLAQNMLDLMDQTRAVAAKLLAVGTPKELLPELLTGCGSHLYSMLMEEYMVTICFVASKQETTFAQTSVEELWDHLVLSPVLPSDLKLGFQLLQNGASSSEEVTLFLSHETIEDLLVKRICKLPPAALSPDAWLLFDQYFNKVNKVAEQESPEPSPTSICKVQGKPRTGLQCMPPMRTNCHPPSSRAQPNPAVAVTLVFKPLEELQGLDMLWAVALESELPEVAVQAQDLLVKVYLLGHHGSAVQGHASSLFTQRCLQLCMDAAGVLVGGAGSAADAMLIPHESRLTPQQQLSARHLQRCLALLVRAVDAGQLPTLPPLASHQCSFRTLEWPLDVGVPTGPTVKRVKFQLSPQEYVGFLRYQVARYMSLNPEDIRLISNGKEWRNDAQLLRHAVVSLVQQRDMPRVALNIMISPKPNDYTLASSDFLQRWLQTPLAIMAREAEMYQLLLILADQPHWAALRGQAKHLLQLLPTCPGLGPALSSALLHTPESEAATQLLDMLQGVVRPIERVKEVQPSMAGDYSYNPCHGPVCTTYQLQALQALLFPTSTLYDCLSPEELQAALEFTANDAFSTEDVLEAEMTGDAMCIATAARPPRLHLSQCLGQAAGGMPMPGRALLLAAHTSKPSPQQRLQLMSSLLSQHCMALQQQLLSSAVTSLHLGEGKEADGMEIELPPSSADSITYVLELHAALVQLLTAVVGELYPNNQSPVSGEGLSGRPSPSPVDVSAASFTDSGAPHFVSNTPSLGTPTGALQALTVTGQEDDCVPDAPSTAAGTPASGLTAAAGGQATMAGLQLSAATIIGLLVQVCSHLGSLASAAAVSAPFEPFTGPAQSGSGAVKADVPLAEAVTVLKDVTALLLQLIKKQPSLVDVLLCIKSACHLVPCLLLHPHFGSLRATMASALRDICLSPSSMHSSPTAYLWLLQQLVCCREAAASNAATSKEFMSLLREVVHLIPSMRVVEHKRTAQELATRLYRFELEALYEVQRCCDFSLPTAQAGVETPADNGDSLVEQEPLRARLQLLTGLICSLELASTGSQAMEGLVHVLLDCYLFPEAKWQNTWREQESSGTPLEPLFWVSNSLDALHGCAVSLDARRAAFDLLLEVMASHAANMTAGCRHLCELLFDVGPIERLKEEKRLEGPEPLRVPGGYTGLRNGGATCYMNSVIQQLFMQPQLRACLLRAQPLPKDLANGDMYAQLQLLMVQLTAGVCGSLRPAAFWDSVKDYDGLPVDIKEHQDAYEFFTRLQDAVDSHMRCTGQQPALARVFGGKFVQQIISREGPHRSEREEDFYQISVDVKGKASLEESLESYVQGELMEGDNAWLCEEMGRKVRATRRMAIKELPPTLVVHLKRFEYDHLQNQRHKVRDRFAFPHILDLYPYTADGLAAADRTRPGSLGTASIPPTNNAAASIKQATAGEELLVPGRAGGQGVLHGTARPPHHLYQLSGVVVHSGSAFAGHYYSYIRERPTPSPAAPASRQSSSALCFAAPVVHGAPAGTATPAVHAATNGAWGPGPAGAHKAACEAAGGGRWFCFDDRIVHPWDVSELEEQCFGGMIVRSPATSGNEQTQPSQPQIPQERAYSAFMLFYDLIQDPCSPPTSPLQPTSCQDDALMDSPMAPFQSPVLGHTFPPAIAVDSPATQPVLTPYGMSLSLYETVLRDNVNLVSRMRALDREFGLFVRKVAEERMERALKRVHKKRRTRGQQGTLLAEQVVDAGGVASMDSEGAMSTDTMADKPAGAPLLDIPKQPHIDAALQVADLGVDFLMCVLFNSPTIIVATEMELWIKLFQTAVDLGGGPTEAIVNRIVYRASDNLYKHSFSSVMLCYGSTAVGALLQVGLGQLLAMLQPNLAMYMRQKMQEIIQQELEAGKEEVQQEARSCTRNPAYRTYAEFINLLLDIVMEHVAVVRQSRTWTPRQRGQQMPHHLKRANEYPGLGYKQVFHQLAIAIRLQANFLNVDGSGWEYDMYDLLNHMALGVHRCTDNYQMDFNELVGLVLQIFERTSRGPMKHVAKDIRMAEAAAIMDYPATLPDDCPDTIKGCCKMKLFTITSGWVEILRLGDDQAREEPSVLTSLLAYDTVVQCCNAHLARALLWGDRNLVESTASSVVQWAESMDVDPLDEVGQNIPCMLRAVSLVVDIPDGHTMWHIMILCSGNGMVQKHLNPYTASLQGIIGEHTTSLSPGGMVGMYMVASLVSVKTLNDLYDQFSTGAVPPELTNIVKTFLSWIILPNEEVMAAWISGCCKLLDAIKDPNAHKAVQPHCRDVEQFIIGAYNLKKRHFTTQAAERKQREAAARAPPPGMATGPPANHAGPSSAARRRSPAATSPAAPGYAHGQQAAPRQQPQHQPQEVHVHVHVQQQGMDTAAEAEVVEATNSDEEAGAEAGPGQEGSQVQEESPEEGSQGQEESPEDGTPEGSPVQEESPEPGMEEEDMQDASSEEVPPSPPQDG